MVINSRPVSPDEVISRSWNTIGWDRSSDFKRHRMMITCAEVFGNWQIWNCKMSFVMTKSIHVRYFGSFELGWVMSEVSWCIAFRCKKSTNTSVGFETDEESNGLDQIIEGRLKSPKRIFGALTLVNMSRYEVASCNQDCSVKSQKVRVNSRWLLW